MIHRKGVDASRVARGLRSGIKAGASRIPSMKTLAAVLASLSVLAEPALRAQPAAATATPSTAVAGRSGEPNVRLTVIEDGGSRVEELKVRGETRRIVVQSKLGGGRYEIIPADGGRDLATGPTTPRGAVGQRVWRVLQF